MAQYPQSFEAYGFTIEVHAGGRRFWPPSFKRFIKDKLDTGELSVGQVMKKCNVSKSLVYKWRADVKASRVRSVAVREERLFSEILVEEEAPQGKRCIWPPFCNIFRMRSSPYTGATRQYKGGYAIEPARILGACERRGGSLSMDIRRFGPLVEFWPLILCTGV